MSNNSLSADPENNVSEWQCPYCDQTRQSLPDLREHITESTEDGHAGVDGLKPTRDLVAYGPEGEEVDRVEGVSTEPADPLEDYDKRELIINAWLAADRDPDRQAVEGISGASQQYVSRLLNELESGEIPRQTYIEVLDYGLKDELEERLEQYDPDEDATEDSPMSAQATADDIIEDASKKDRIIAAYHVEPDIDKKAAADALDVSYEYVRQIFNDIDEREPSELKKLTREELEKEPDQELKDAVWERFQEEGVITDSTEAEEAEPQAAETTAGRSSGSVGTAETPPVESIQDVRGRMQLLLEQAQYTESKEAEFVARKGIDWLDELSESTDSE